MIFNWHEHLVAKFLSVKTAWNTLKFVGCRTVSLFLSSCGLSFFFNLVYTV